MGGWSAKKVEFRAERKSEGLGGGVGSWPAQRVEAVSGNFLGGTAAVRANRGWKPDTPLLPLIAALGSAMIENYCAANAVHKSVPDCRRKNGTLRHRAQMGNRFAGKDRSIIDQVLAAASPVPRSKGNHSRVRLFKKREQRTGGCVAARGKVTGAKFPPTMPINATD